MRHSKLGGAGAAILAGWLAQGIQAQETISPLDPWSGFRPGSWVRLKLTVEKGGKKTQESEMTATLESLGESETQVRHDYGRGQLNTFLLRRDGAGCIAPRVEAPSSLRDVKKEALGEEDLEIAGRSVRCKVRSVTFQKVLSLPPNGGSGQHVEDIAIKLWESGEIQGRIARIEGKDGLKRFSGKVKALDEKLTIGSKTISCALLEVDLKPNSPDARWTQNESLWVSNSIPGGVARRKIVPDGGAWTYTYTVQDFESKE